MLAVEEALVMTLASSLEYVPGPGPQLRYLAVKVVLPLVLTNPFPYPFLESDSFSPNAILDYVGSS